MRNRLQSAGQASLDFAALAAEEEREVSLADIEALDCALAGRGWMTRAALVAVLGAGWTERKVRAVARASAPGVVSFPGSKGYKTWKDCTLEELNACIDSFKSQAKDMTQRAFIYEQALHARHRG